MSEIDIDPDDDDDDDAAEDVAEPVTIWLEARIVGVGGTASN